MSDEQKTVTIEPGHQILTLVNTFTCADMRQGELVAALEESLVEAFTNVDGFISASVHASLDRTRVVNYMQWRSATDFDRAEQQPKVQEHLAKIMTIAESADPRLFHVSSVHTS